MAGAGPVLAGCAPIGQALREPSSIRDELDKDAGAVHRLEGASGGRTSGGG